MNALFDILAIVCVLGGMFFCIVTLVGVVRFPDVLNRMHAASKAGTFGASLPLLAIVFAHEGLSTNIRALATIAFLFMTGPVAAHLLARASYRRSGESLQSNLVVDELKVLGVADPAEPLPTRFDGAEASIPSTGEKL